MTGCGGILLTLREDSVGKAGDEDEDVVCGFWGVGGCTLIDSIDSLGRKGGGGCLRLMRCCVRT